MIDAEVIIVGGGPAGAACAWKLRQHGIQPLILDKKSFPRRKICAGWITPLVFRSLQTNKEEYPFGVLTFRRIIFHVSGITIPVPTRQYSIRRYEFDAWLIKRAAVSIRNHHVRQIKKDGKHYIIDDMFRCTYLIGAGGTHCPVFRTFFDVIYPRSQNTLIVTMEEEIEYHNRNNTCHLWFFDRKFPGYSWYVPKADGYLNIGIGGRFATLKKRGDTIRDHWNDLVQKLTDFSLVEKRAWNPRGHNYYLRQPVGNARLENAFIIGDAAGLATIDMGEGIGPAVESGIRAADAIAGGGNCSLRSIRKYSLFNLMFPWLT
jgi:flavin-dependent dehydrogenase